MPRLLAQPHPRNQGPARPRRVLRRRLLLVLGLTGLLAACAGESPPARPLRRHRGRGA
jgi:hypothetical protein